MRPLPQLTPFNEWFWTSGADGKLRIQRCTECSTLVHPPVPICPACRSREWEPSTMSGRATVVGFTVNAHQWLPGFEPPYVIANVALADDPAVRLTTNIVDCAPDDVHIGQEVAVRFEQQDDVWIPLFAPTGGTDPVERVPEPVRPVPRPPVSRDRFEHRAVLSGTGRSAIGRRLLRDPLSLTVDACLDAIADAGLTPGDIDGLSTYPGAAPGGMSEGGVTAVEEALRLHPTWINGGMDLPGPGGSLIAAMLAVASGLCRHVLCFRTVWESTYATLRLGGMPAGRVSGPLYEWRAPYGAMSAAHWIATNAHQYMHRYGASREDTLACIALNGRANAARNPRAIYRNPMTMDDYLGARPITSPFGLYDCDVPCDASVAVIVSDAAVAPDLPKPAIRVDAVGTQITERISWEQDTITHEPQVLGPAAHLWSRTAPHTRRRRPRAPLRRLHVQRDHVAGGTRLLRSRRGEGLARRRPPHRARRRAAREPARWPAVGGPHARLRVRRRGGHPAPPRSRRAAGGRCTHRRRDLGRRYPVGRAAAAARRRMIAPPGRGSCRMARR